MINCKEPSHISAQYRQKNLNVPKMRPHVDYASDGCTPSWQVVSVVRQSCTQASIFMTESSSVCCFSSTPVYAIQSGWLAFCLFVSLLANVWYWLALHYRLGIVYGFHRRHSGSKVRSCRTFLTLEEELSGVSVFT